MSEIRSDMSAPHPGAFIRDEILEPHHLSRAAVARLLRVRVATISDLVNGKTRLSPEMALRFEKAFGISMMTLLRLQCWHDVQAQRRRAHEVSVRRYRGKRPS
jgi:addiction module HigA family antidote